MLSHKREMFILAALLWMLGSNGNAAAAQFAGVKKQPLHGLVTMGDIGTLMREGGYSRNALREANAHPGVYRGVVLALSWKELEPTEGQLDVSSIESALDRVRAYNRKYPVTPLKAKIRIFAGWNTPGWVIAKSEGPLVLTDKLGTLTIGRFWTARYRRAWRQFQDLLAKQYDKNPLIGEVAVSSCATISAEPFILPMNPHNHDVLYAAGFNDRRHEACLLGAIQDYAAWKNTPIDYTVNPIRLTDEATWTLDEGFVRTVLVKFRKKYGSRGVIANHGLKMNLFPRDRPICSLLKKLGSPIAFQTYNPRVNWPGSVALGMQYGATEIEVWNTKASGGAAAVSYSELRQWAQELDGK